MVTVAVIGMPTKIISRCDDVVVLVHSDCYNKISQTGYLKQQESLLLTVLEAGNPRSRHHHGPILVKALFLFHTWHLLAVSSHGGRVWGALWGLLYKGINPIHEGPILMTLLIASQRPNPLIPLPLGIRISTYEFWRDANVQTIAVKNIIILH